MNKYKVYVYAIAKNEEKNVNDWIESMSEADGIFVMLDATSSDGTERLLKDAGVVVEKKLIKPWRFDVARNESLKLVPEDADICVCTDIDEVFSKGWRKILENTWQKDTNQAIYKYWHNHGFKNDVPNIFDYSKIHDRKNFVWKWIIHEYIVPNRDDFYPNTVYLDGVMLYHNQDVVKQRSYKKLLEDAIKLEPDDMRYQLLLLEEYVKTNEIGDVEFLIQKILQNKELDLPSNFGFAYKLITQIDIAKNNFEKARSDCFYALSKIPNCKWFYGELGQLLINHFEDYELGIAMLEKCLNIKENVIVARETEWNDKARIHNIISIGYFHLQNYVSALENINFAIDETLNENDKAIFIKNKQIYENKLTEDISSISKFL